MNGLIYEIQRYCVDDGPGIRTVVFFKGCPLRCPWCHNPESQDSGQEIGVYINRCINCMKCYEACPRDAIIFGNPSQSPFKKSPLIPPFNKGGEGGLKGIDREICDRCGLCVDACPSRCLVRIGKYYKPDELLFEILKDLPFYKASDGGVTFSGGEPIYQSEFLKEILALCKKRGIHTAIETSGYAPWEKLENIMEYTDLFLYDLKIWDAGLHKKYIGADNRIVKENFARLVRSEAKVIPRIPLIPDFTFTKANLESWAKFLAENYCKQVHLLPFHAFGESKTAVVGKKTGGDKRESLDEKPQFRAYTSEIFEGKGIRTHPNTSF